MDPAKNNQRGGIRNTGNKANAKSPNTNVRASQSTANVTSAPKKPEVKQRVVQNPVGESKAGLGKPPVEVPKSKATLTDRAPQADQVKTGTLTVSRPALNAIKHKGKHKQINSKDSAPDPTQSGAVRLNELSEVEPLKQYDAENTYPAFMQNLAEVDNSGLKPKDKQTTKVRLLSEFHHHLKTLPVSEILNFGRILQLKIEEHEETDSLEKAFVENRAIYRSWHLPGRISEAGEVGEVGVMGAGGRELVGADSLNVSLDPTRFRTHKAKTKSPNSKLAPLGAVPSSLLYPGQENTIFYKNRGTATALLPENLYAGFSAYNETVKSLLREKTLEELGDDAEALCEHVEFMRASVTRPVFFDKEDIQSSTGAFIHPDKPGGPHVRKIHSYLGENHNPLNESLDQKLSDPLRSNAIFYQTFSQHSKSDPAADEWNEMVVKYRSTGHTAGLHENIREWVPGLKPNESVNKTLKDSGKFNANYSESTAAWEKTHLKGQDYDPKKEKKRKK
jgi:hypothetical protein